MCVNRSTDLVKSNQLNFLADLRECIVANKKVLILGDFDFNAICIKPVSRFSCEKVPPSPGPLLNRQRFILSEFENWNFRQIIQHLTHVIITCYDIIEVKIKDI